MRAKRSALPQQVTIRQVTTRQVTKDSFSTVYSFSTVNGLKNAEFMNSASLTVYYIPITDTTLELSVFCPSDTESQINELRFSESISLSFKTRLRSVTCFFGDVTYYKLQAWNQRRKNIDVTSRNVTLWQMFPQFFGIKDQNGFYNQKECQKKGI